MRRSSLLFLLTMCAVAVISYSFALRLNTSGPAAKTPPQPSTSWATKLATDYTSGPIECKDGSTDLPLPSLGIGCEKISIDCDTSAEVHTRDMGGFCAAARCELNLSQSVCADFHLAPGQTDTSVLEHLLVASHPEFAFDQVWDQCRIRHEMQHLRDGPLRPICNFEFRGVTTQIACLRSYEDRCPAAGQAFCDALHAALCRTQGALRLLRCACENEKGAGEACPECIDTCTSEYAACLTSSHLSGKAELECKALESNYCRLKIGQ